MTVGVSHPMRLLCAGVVCWRGEQAWAHNPVALLSVCLLAQAYKHAAELVLQFGALEMSVPFLVQIDRLVQLFESPVLTQYATRNPRTASATTARARCHLSVCAPPLHACAPLCMRAPAVVLSSAAVDVRLYASCVRCWFDPLLGGPVAGWSRCWFVPLLGGSVRLQLLEVEEHPYLLKALWGILMLCAPPTSVPSALVGRGG
jgi:hypothetical protein